MNALGYMEALQIVATVWLTLLALAVWSVPALMVIVAAVAIATMGENNE